jgi:hypothetical protein
MFIFVRFLSLVLFVLPALSYASDFTHTYKIHDKGVEPYLEVCVASTTICRKISFPDAADYYFEDPTYVLHDLDKDGVPELIVTNSNINGTVNVGSIFFRINDNNKFEIIKNNDSPDAPQMTNITFHDNKVVSSYRDAGSWYDEVYDYVNGKFEIKLRDKQGLIRTIFDRNGNELDSFLLKEDSSKRWFEREILTLTARIKPPKAILYNSAGLHDASKMYLVKDDIVTLKNYQYSENGETVFYLAEYITTNNKKIIKWINKEALSINH